MRKRTLLSAALGAALDQSLLLDHETIDSIRMGMAKIERAKRTEEIARPMREMFDLLQSGETMEINGMPVMRLPEIDAAYDEGADLCAIPPALSGWAACWEKITPDISAYHMRVLADRLAQDKEITPRLVELARMEFDATVARIPETPDGVISSAIVACQIKWEFERMESAQ